MSCRRLFWTLFDRRYHMAWVTQLFIAIGLLVMILTSDWWAPFASMSHLWDKVIDLGLCLVLFLVLSYETRPVQGMARQTLR